MHKSFPALLFLTLRSNSVAALPRQCQDTGVSAHLYLRHAMPKSPLARNLTTRLLEAKESKTPETVNRVAPIVEIRSNLRATFHNRSHSLYPRLQQIRKPCGNLHVLDPGNGNIVWATSVGPGRTLGGIEWGPATDGSRICAAIRNNGMTSYALANGGPTISWGSWAALDAKTGSILWQIADPTPGAIDVGSLSVGNGVLYADSCSGYVYAINAATREILWSFNTGGSVIDSPSIVNGVLYWGSGFAHIPPGTPNNKVYAFTIP